MSILSSKIMRYSDLDGKLIPHPLTGDITNKKDIESVINSVKNLISANYYERPFSPYMGGNIVSQLFEGMNFVTTLAIQDQIKRVLEEHEPRVANVRAIVNAQENGYYIQIFFEVISLSQEVEVNFYFKSIR